MSYQCISSTPPHLEKKINNYTYQTNNLLGKGSYSSVYLGTDHDRNIPVAIKIIENSLLRDEYIHNLINQECLIMQSLAHPHVVRLYEVLSTVNRTYIIQEYCNQQDLSKLLTQKVTFSEQEVILIFSQILEGFKELLQHGIIHRDIKPANILIHEGLFKIADFGFAIHVEGLNDNLRSSLVGTPLYMSPQCLNGEGYSSKNDIWSLGIIFYELIFGDVPWPVNSKFELIQAFKTRPLRFPHKISAILQNFIECCLKISENDRIDWEELYCHPLFKSDQPIQKGMVFKRDCNNQLTGIAYNDNKEEKPIIEYNREYDISTNIFSFVDFIGNLTSVTQKMSRLHYVSNENLLTFDVYLMKYVCKFLEKLIMAENPSDLQIKMMNSDNWDKNRKEMEKKHQMFLNHWRKLANNIKKNEQIIENHDDSNEIIVKCIKNLIREGNHLLLREFKQGNSDKIRILFQFVSLLVVCLEAFNKKDELLEKELDQRKYDANIGKIKDLVLIEDLKKLRKMVYELD